MSTGKTTAIDNQVDHMLQQTRSQCAVSVTQCSPKDGAVFVITIFKSKRNHAIQAWQAGDCFIHNAKASRAIGSVIKNSFNMIGQVLCCA